MFVAMYFIQARMNPLSTAERALLDDASFEALKAADLSVVVKPYAAIGILLAIVFVLILLTKIPVRKIKTDGMSLAFGPTLKRLFGNKTYRDGVVAQFFYIGAQITCWTFIIQYGTHVFMAEGVDEQSAEIMSQRLNIVAMALFCCSRFVCTALMRFFRPAVLLSVFAAAAIVLSFVVVIVGGRVGVYSLVAVSICMSLMFPTIYGLALKDVGPDAEIGSAGLIMAILGGSLLPPVQALIIDGGYVEFSFIVPLLCFVVVLCYGLKCKRLTIDD